MLMTMSTLSIFFSFSAFLYEVYGMSCGIDKSPISHVYDGIGRIETYPWLGILFYPYEGKKITTAVVLVTRQIVLASAAEIDKLPKTDFRERARVVIGFNCSGPSIGIRDYSYHPDYSRETYSTLAIIQLETDHVKFELRPICPPPSHFTNQHFFAMIMSDNCKRSKVRIHRMKYVSPDQCKTFYRRSGLDVDTLWPSHTACARSLTGGRCVWRSGAILVVKTGKRWRLLGFGVYGPGCQAPARFLDYGMYYTWVQRRVERIGRPAVTTLAPNHIILRRSLSNVQRFGPCDKEETKVELYTDDTKVSYTRGTIKYNVTILADVEYSCVVFRADYVHPIGEGTPQLRLRRWCAGSKGLCYGFQFLEIEFYVEISFELNLNFKVMAYGREAKVIDAGKALKYINYEHEFPKVDLYSETKEKVAKMLDDSSYPWFNKS